VAAVALCATLLSAAPVQGQTLPGGVPPDQLLQRLRDERRGLVYDGLVQRLGGLCSGAFEIPDGDATGRTRCTHGPDPAPDGVDVRQRQDFGAAAAAAPPPAVAAAQSGIPCYGTGSDGYRVQLLYVRQAGTADKSGTYFPNFATWAANANATYKDSAATGGVRNIRFVTDAACNLVIQKVEVSAGGISSLSNMISELRSKGLTRSDRKYLAWVDGNVYCGIGEIYIDDRAFTTPGLTNSNYSNGNPQVQGTFARVDNGCWGQTNSVEAHELTHMLGGVQRSAPHATTGFHCRDESDRMCYSDAAGVTMMQVCPVANERLLDCNGDDYFSTNPASGSWLATHWNVASSAFLATSNPGNPPPPPPTTTTTTVKPATTTTLVAGTPSAPRNLAAYRFSSGILLYWSAPVTGPVTGYNVYRKAATGSFGKIAAVGTSTNFTDSTGSVGVTYTYAVSAVNGSHESGLSNLVTATR